MPRLKEKFNPNGQEWSLPTPNASYYGSVVKLFKDGERVPYAEALNRISKEQTGKPCGVPVGGRAGSRHS